MNRRHALAAVAAASVGLADPSVAKPARAADFAAAAAHQPLLQPFKGVSDATGDLQSEALQQRLVGCCSGKVGGPCGLGNA